VTGASWRRHRGALRFFVLLPLPSPPHVLVLVVDDDEHYARAVARVLRFNGLEVRVAGSGAEAARLVEGQEWGMVAGALLDQTLPDTSGTELAEFVRAKNARTEISIVSGLGDSEELRDQLVARNLPFIRKPVTDGALRNWSAGLIARSPIAKFEQALAHVKDVHGLTPREVDVLRAARARSPEHKVVAEVLGIRVETVRTHVKKILRKTRAGSLRDLIKRLDEGS
jgi:two-component system, NarL family, response regulator DesR